MAVCILAQANCNSMVYGCHSSVQSLQTSSGFSAGLWRRRHPRLAKDACKTICRPERHHRIVVAKLATTPRSISSRGGGGGGDDDDDDEVSNRQRRSSRNTASTSGRALQADGAADLRRGRAATDNSNGRRRDRDVSPDASWSYAFASPTTKPRTARSRPGNSKDTPSGLPRKQTQRPAALLGHWLARGVWDSGATYSFRLQKKHCTQHIDALSMGPSSGCGVHGRL